MRNKIIHYKGNHWAYRARCAGETNAKETVLYGRNVGKESKWKKELSLFDHGNGVEITGVWAELKLDYSQLSDLYHLLDAHNRGEDGWMWGEYEVTIRNTPKRKSRKKESKK